MAEHPKSKSTRGFYHPEWSPCKRCLLAFLHAGEIPAGVPTEAVRRLSAEDALDDDGGGAGGLGEAERDGAQRDGNHPQRGRRQTGGSINDIHKGSTGPENITCYGLREIW